MSSIQVKLHPRQKWAGHHGTASSDGASTPIAASTRPTADALACRDCDGVPLRSALAVGEKEDGQIGTAPVGHNRLEAC